MDPQEAAAQLLSLTGLAFSKMHATGNDFVVFEDAAGDRDLSPERVRALCDRHLGIGGDGVIRAVRSEHLVEGRELLAQDPGAEWFMDYRNADGSIAEMCGNGVRAYAHFLLSQGLTQMPAQGLRVATRAGVKVVRSSGDGYSVDMGPWAFIYPERAQAEAMDSAVTTQGEGIARPSLSVTMGNPHTVVALPDAAELAELDLTAQPVVEPLPANGVNIEYVVPAEPLVQDRIAAISMRVHERGVGETLSCGTGICAAVVATRHWAGNAGDAAQAWAVSVPGGVCGVRFETRPDGAEHVILSGPAVRVAGGVLG
ncbi:diaminopimelate epimerase [Galactobacter caseinivorans]|uniref:Diaminopimelate epimerase n=1 Tax=Galactobacter caseinivorans TaxID=2676123 RepID=A0A496PJY9_9MICC|nr:diaminopimelate epimerase [Galactobacter caseinivorans]RKW70809.1 diaminopimelate epimerase [Galactobacter caseinivorans]